MATQPWRLIPLSEGTGVENMAIDSWLLDQHAQGKQPASLRFYTWRSPTLSLGYHQRQFPAHWNNLHWQGQPIELIRRPTGGRAVLHQGDLTYALVTSGQQGSRREVYRQLCQWLIAGWQQLGVSLSLGEAKRGEAKGSYAHNPNCFGTATAADLVMANGYKLIGSAQVYRNGCILQHGSIRLRPDSALFEKVFGEAVPLEGGAIAPPPLPGTVLSKTGIDTLVAALTQAAEDSFRAKWSIQGLSPAERQEALQASTLPPANPSANSA
jgi:lipoate---protein ligase